MEWMTHLVYLAAKVLVLQALVHLYFVIAI